MTTDEDDPDERAQLQAELLVLLYGDRAPEMVERLFGTPPTPAAPRRMAAVESIHARATELYESFLERQRHAPEVWGYREPAELVQLAYDQAMMETRNQQ